MGGILDEYRLFREQAPDAAVLPIMSTGGAAWTLGKEIGASRALEANLDYVELLYAQLNIHPNEQRYVKLADQPSDVEARLVKPGR